MATSPGWIRRAPLPNSTGQAVLITGAARRVGRAIALHLAAQGYDIALHYHMSEAEAQATQAEIKALGVACEAFRADLGDIAGLPALVAMVMAAFPHCAHLINNASTFERKLFMEADVAQFDRDFLVNLKAPVFLTQAFARALAKPASVVNIVDAKVDATKHGYFFYLMAKKSLRDFTLMAAAELGPDMRVNAVCPGVVLPAERDAAYREMQSTPQAVAEAVHRLIAAAGVTGEVVFVDGRDA